jgi:hypothetical protein
MDTLPELVNIKIRKYQKDNCLKELTKDTYEIPFGDFGCLARQIHSVITYDEDGNEIIPFSNYSATIYECVENYINHFNSCNDFEKQHIREALRSYEDNLNGPLYQSFPFQEWLYHPVNGNIHSGASFGMTNVIIREYLLRPKDYKLKWSAICKKYLD